jgi:hypothetical protein
MIDDHASTRLLARGCKVNFSVTNYADPLSTISLAGILRAAGVQPSDVPSTGIFNIWLAGMYTVTYY